MSERAREGGFRAGFICFVGRPNAGKSTLTNAIVGQKIAITSSRPQTTRHVVRGVLHRPDAQLVLVDTPGLHKPKTLLGERLNDLVRATWSEVDVIGLCMPADEAVGPGDRFIASEIGGLKASVIAVVTKTDLVPKARLAEQLLAVSRLGEFADVVPVSAVTGDQLDVLVDVMARHLPPSPQLYPDDMITDEPEQVMVAELIREAALEGVRDELPHSIAVVVEEMFPAEGRERPDEGVRRHLRRAAEPEVHCDRCWRRPAARRRHARPARDRGAAGHAGLPRPARTRGQGVAARPQATASVGLLISRRRRMGGCRCAFRSTATTRSCCACRSSGESDRIITMLTRRHGRVRAAAKGIRRTTSRFGARLEPFGHVDVQLAGDPGNHARSLHTVRQAESIELYGKRLGRDYPRYTAASAVAETAERLTPVEFEPSLRLFQLTLGALRAPCLRRNTPAPWCSTPTCCGRWRPPGGLPP